MPNRQPPPDPRRDEQRPTLPPIRQLFGSELSQAVPPQQSRQHSTSPQIPFHRLAIADEDRRSRPQSPAAGLRGNASSSQTYPSYQGGPRPSTPGHLRNASDPAQRAIYGAHPHPSQYANAGHPGFQPRVPQGTDRIIPASGTYPYAASQQAYPSMPIASTSSAGDAAAGRSSSSRYECNYCGKGFTRPSSLKIHTNTHTGEKPFTCPYEGCGRSFSVQSNMRRHARVHERSSGSQPEADDDSPEEGDEQPTSNTDKAAGNANQPR
ncbi:hypothetical protein IEO21_01401 [Rhodonia placenta]|uniref:C2H2-type domain-containing protein n=2 Tax=Rhodonia placenta TaxID=104341 RepID=A0A1X6ND30_9APHY|nr:hypothetical protein POSPLADRAFT_1166442 [Postia placenta MAD-698-R-SB12]KAF9820392.1 hypothetical protein IEO21_01401 [Postia placenta]OSX66430.1 hypothetical protein POSPLADRAFT_1166442 [Postia placenta MAD-698-R-SB12]